MHAPLLERLSHVSAAPNEKARRGTPPPVWKKLSPSVRMQIACVIAAMAKGMAAPAAWERADDGDHDDA